MSLGYKNRIVLQIINQDQVVGGGSEADMLANHVFAPCRCVIENVWFSADVIESGNTPLYYLNAGATEAATLVASATTLVAGSNQQVEGTLVAAEKERIYEKGQEFSVSLNCTNAKDTDGFCCQITLREMDP